MSAAAVAIQIEPAKRMPQLARRIIDAICRHPTLTRQEQTRHLAVLERALTLAKGSEERLAVLHDQMGVLQSLSRTDFLTGIPNRRALEDHVRTQLAAANRHGDTGVLALFDLDHFKDVNDRHGHAAGDEVLRWVADVLSRNIRGSDFAARLAADQFAVLFAHTAAREGLYRARRLQSLLRETVVDFDDGDKFAIEASIGAANYGPGADLAGLFHRASIGLFRQKRSRGLRFTRLAS